MATDAYCRICGNEKDRMNDHKMGCVSCYAASGPDWTLQWLFDAISVQREAAEVVQLASYRLHRDNVRPHERTDSTHS